MIMIVTGLAGSGKTNTCYAVMYGRSYSRVVFYDTDLFTGRIPLDWHNKNDIEAIYQRAGLLIGNDVARGDSTFILTLSMPMLRYFKEFSKYFQSAGPIFLFCLWCGKEEVIRRIYERNRHQKQRQVEIESVDSDYEHLRRFINSSKFAFQIDNTNITERQAAEKIIGIIDRHTDQGVIDLSCLQSPRREEDNSKARSTVGASAPGR
jgi:broad-specificity NMP kinase